jgi:hypothetical protein
MKILLLSISLIFTTTILSQDNEVVGVIEEIGIDEAGGANAPYLSYADDEGELHLMWFLLPAIRMNEWAEISFNGKLLIKVISVDNLVEGSISGPYEYTYEFHPEVAEMMKGERLIIMYSHVLDEKYLDGFQDYLFDFDITE